MRGRRQRAGAVIERPSRLPTRPGAGPGHTWRSPELSTQRGGQHVLLWGLSKKTLTTKWLGSAGPARMSSRNAGSSHGVQRAADARRRGPRANHHFKHPQPGPQRVCGGPAQRGERIRAAGGAAVSAGSRHSDPVCAPPCATRRCTSTARTASTRWIGGPGPCGRRWQPRRRLPPSNASSRRQPGLLQRAGASPAWKLLASHIVHSLQYAATAARSRADTRAAGSVPPRFRPALPGAAGRGGCPAAKVRGICAGDVPARACGPAGCTGGLQGMEARLHEFGCMWPPTWDGWGGSHSRGLQELHVFSATGWPVYVLFAVV